MRAGGSVALAPAAGCRAVDGFVGFAIGRSIREDAIAAHRRGELEDTCAGYGHQPGNLRYADLYRTSDPELVGREHRPRS